MVAWEMSLVQQAFYQGRFDQHFESNLFFLVRQEVLSNEVRPIFWT